MKTYRKPFIKTLDIHADSMFLAASGETNEYIQIDEAPVNPEDAQAKQNGQFGTSKSLWDE